MSAIRIALARLFGRRGDGRFDVRRLRRRGRLGLQAEIRALTQFAYLGDATGLCRVLGRYKLFVDTRDAGLFPHLALDGYWEMWVTELLARHLRSGMVAVDVGANVGYFTMLMADLVGPAGHVHAFEPNPAALRHLRRSVPANGFADRVTLYGDPLGEQAGQRVLLDVPPGYPGGAAIVPAPDEATDGVLTTRRLDGYPAVLDADIVKIDAEGAEQAIWRGMAGIFARGRAMTVLLEFVPSRYVDPAGFLGEIAAAGFALNRVSAAQDLAPIAPAQILAAPREEDIMLVLVRGAAGERR